MDMLELRWSMPWLSVVVAEHMNAMVAAARD
jgi:hypothetical protein